MPEAKKSAASKRIVDVKHAGKTPPSDTSRPVIVTSRPILRDPMMAASPDTPDPEESTTSPALPTTSTHNQVQPIADETTTAPDEAAETPAEAESGNETGPETEPAPEKPDSDTIDKNPDALAAQTAERQAEHEAAVQQLIDSKQYFVPINSVEKRRSKRFVALGMLVSLLLALAWVNIALDASLIELNGIKPLTHFFSS